MSDNPPLLSILILTIPERRNSFLQSLLGDLEKQALNQPVEILCLYDNCTRSVGEKRNCLLREAKGEFIVFLDDDDRVVPDYVSTIIATIKENPDADCICYTRQVQIAGREAKLYPSGLGDNLQEVPGLDLPPHTLPWRRELVKDIQFPEINFGEDPVWVRKACKRIRKWVKLDRVMYYYDFNRDTTATYRRTPLKYGPTSTVEVSVVMSTFQKPEQLKYTLNSILQQDPPFNFEVIVVDDSPRDDYRTEKICNDRLSTTTRLILRYFRTNNDQGYRNPGPARNLGYKKAKGDIIIAQSDDVIHSSNETSIEQLAHIERDTFNIATVYNAMFQGPVLLRQLGQYTGHKTERPLFFLGSVRREDVCKIGGNCEEFTEPGYEDNWFSDCLMYGLGLKPVYRDDVIGYHQDHERPNLQPFYQRMGQLYEQKRKEALVGVDWWVGGAPWPYEAGVAVERLNLGAKS